MRALPLLTGIFCAVNVSGAELPVREVVLYKHGVGFFERLGNLGPGETARLDFKTSEMNDVLKSLTIGEQGGGKVTGLRYDSSVPLDRKLEQYPFTIEAGQPLSKILDQFRGATLELEFNTEKVSGVIVSARPVSAGKDTPERDQVTLLLATGELRNFDLGAAAKIRFTDPKLQTQLKDYLSAIAGSRSVDKRSVYIDSTDSKPHQVAASYIIPSPVWKSSYRLFFENGGQPSLEGWAIVDNTTGEDWNNVQMSLVSGKPISFISALYDPKYIDRKTADLPENEAVAPTIHAGAMEKMIGSGNPAAMMQANGNMRLGGVAGGMAGGMPGGTGGGVVGGILGGMPHAAMAPPPPPAPSSVVQQAAASEVGELFEYRIAAPVTIRKEESAMLPFLQQKITARKLLIYSEGTSIHPLQAAELTNSTGKTLDGGPITIYDGGTYGGEALVETVKQNDKRLISYAVDLGTRVTTAYDSFSNTVREVHVRRGFLISKSAEAQTKTYTVHNADAKAKTMVVEHPVRQGYTLLSPKASETTPTAYRFEVALPPNSTEKLAVSEERVYDAQLTLTNISPDVLVTYVQNTHLSEAARRSLKQILDSKRQIADYTTQISNMQSQTNEITQDQERLRQNISTLNNVSGQQQQVQGYAAKLAAQDQQMSALQTQLRELQRKQAAAQTALNSLIEQMEF